MSPTRRHGDPRARTLACTLAGVLVCASCGVATPSLPVAAHGTAAPGATDSGIPPGSPGARSPTAGIPPVADFPFARADLLGSLVDPGPGPSGRPDVAWHLDRLGASHVLPVIGSGLLIAVSSVNGYVVAVDARTGAERWRARLAKTNDPLDLAGSPAVADGTVFVADPSSVHAFDLTTGAERWATPVPTTGPRLGPRLRVAAGVVYMGTPEGLVGFDERTGKLVFSWRGPDGGTSGFGPIADGVAYVAGADGAVYAVNLDDDATIWRRQTISGTIGTPEVAGDTLYIGTLQGDATEPVGALYAIDRTSGGVRWMFQTPGKHQMTAGPVHDGVIDVGSAGDGLYALRDLGGSNVEIVAQQDAPNAYFGLALADGVLYEQRDDGSIGAYAADDLRPLWETDPTGDNGIGPPVVSGGFIFAVHEANGVYAYADHGLIADLALPAPSATPMPESTAAPLFNPFSVDRVYPWDSLGIPIPLGQAVGPDGLLYVLSTKPEVVVIDPASGNVVKRWGSQGSGRGQFDLRRADDNPGYGDIDVAPDGRVYVADGSNHRVQVFSKTGGYLFSIGSFGTGDGQFETPAEITLGRDGRVYVREEHGPISTFTGDGTFLHRIDNRDGARDLVVRPDGSIVATCDRCYQLLELSTLDARVIARHDVPMLDGDGIGPTSSDASGDIAIELYASETILVFDRQLSVLGGMRLPEGSPGATLGHVADYGAWYWPVPLFLPDGRAITFDREGLVVMKVDLTR